MDEKKIRRQRRKDFSAWGWALLIYYLLMTVCVIISVCVEMIFRTFSQEPVSDLSLAMENGWGYLVACVLAVLLIRVWKGKAFFIEMWKTEREMKPGDFFGLLSVFISAQLVFQICATFQELVLNALGLSALEAMQQATAGGDTLSMFLYVSLGAPVVEEIIFRGAILRGLEKYGKRMAILISALLFGLFHGNILQSPYAFMVGLVLGYVALEYNIHWAMVLHMINNLVLGDMLPRLTRGLGEIGSAFVLQGVIIAFAIAGAVCFVRNRKTVLEYHRSNPLDWSAMGPLATAPGILMLIIVMEINAISMLFL